MSTKPKAVSHTERTLTERDRANEIVAFLKKEFGAFEDSPASEIAVIETQLSYLLEKFARAEPNPVEPVPAALPQGRGEKLPRGIALPIVKAVLKNLKDRKGVGDELDGIDEDI